MLLVFFSLAELTGITPQVLAANHALPFRDVWAQFALWLSEVAAEAEAEGADEAGSEGGEGVEGGDGGSGSGGVVFVAHNAKFDHKFLMEEQERGGFDKWVGLGWVGLGWVGLGWVGLGWVGLGGDACYDRGISCEQVSLFLHRGGTAYT